MFKRPLLAFALAVGSAVLVGLNRPPAQVLVSAVFVYLALCVGTAILGSFARPAPEPPPAGELRKVRIGYRCSICGAEVRMTVAPDEEPQAPRHCLEDMDLMAPIDGF
jgi:hypothetical protein